MVPHIHSSLYFNYEMPKQTCHIHVIPQLNRPYNPLDNYTTVRAMARALLLVQWNVRTSYRTRIHGSRIRTE
jgi:hypothetical protein